MKKIISLYIIILIILGSFGTIGTNISTKKNFYEDNTSNLDNYETNKDIIEALRKQGEIEGWTFTVGENEATKYSIDELCGTKEPDEIPDSSHFNTCLQQLSNNDLPDSFDWRTLQDFPDIRNQGGCGSCWAFAAIAPFEFNILYRDGESVDLSEQWLISCNKDGADCDGGWYTYAFKYLLGKEDGECGGTGAVLEEDFTYKASDVPCGESYPHHYLIDSWGFVGEPYEVPSVDSIKQAIYYYGPVAVCIYSGSAFQFYMGGVFNADSDKNTNHEVVLVGWNDTDGCWILRNSWGTSWGEDGYMRIKYGCCSVGYRAAYVDYHNNLNKHTVKVEIKQITNDDNLHPDGGKYEQIDSLEPPEWCYRVGGEADGKTIYHHKSNEAPGNGWIFDRIKEHTWNVNQVHLFHINDACIELTIKLKDWDMFPNPDDLADVSAYTGGGKDDNTSDDRASIYHGTYNLITDELTGDNVTEDGEYFVTTGDGEGKNEASVWFKITDDLAPIPDLECEGSLNWDNVQTGETVHGNFKVKNIGGPNSKLDWQIDAYPTWGSSWTITPSSGKDLSPEDSPVTIAVSFRAPDEKDKFFSGNIKVINKEDSSDYEIIPVSISTKNNVADLDATGYLIWDDALIEPGIPVEGTIHVRNIGEPGSKLDWRITEHPSWGIWTFEPECDENLEPGKRVNISVTIVTPDEEYESYSGSVRIVNEQDPNDYVDIETILKTSRNKFLGYKFLQKFFELFPLFKILKK